MLRKGQGRQGGLSRGLRRSRFGCVCGWDGGGGEGRMGRWVGRRSRLVLFLRRSRLGCVYWFWGCWREGGEKRNWWRGWIGGVCVR